MANHSGAGRDDNIPCIKRKALLKKLVSKISCRRQIELPRLQLDAVHIPCQCENKTSFLFAYQVDHSNLLFAVSLHSEGVI